MRKKQLFAMALAGVLAMGMAPSTAFAEEDIDMLSAVEITAETEETGETLPETSAEEAPAETPAEEAPVEVPAETPAETPAEVPAETPAETTTEEVQNMGETPEEVPTVTPAAGEGTTVSTEAELLAAVAAAPDSASEEDITTIIVGADIDLTQTVVIPANKRITLVGVNTGVLIGRAAGFTGDMFRVDGGILSFQAGTTAGSTDEGSITVSGMLEGQTADGSIIHVTSGTFGMDESITLQDNVTSTTGGAIKIEAAGRVVLIDGSIYNNQAADGGAIYCEGTLEVQGNVDVASNTATDGSENNVALAASAFLGVRGAFTESASIGIHSLTPAAGVQVIQIAEGLEVESANILSAVFYDGGGLTIDENGMLAEIQVEPELSLVEGPVWNSRTSVTLTCVSDSDGWYYAGWAVTGTEAPTFAVDQDGTPITAGQNFTITLDDLDADQPITVYVLVKDLNDNLSAKKAKDLDEATRPAPAATPTPVATATPTPTAVPTATAAPTATPTPAATPTTDPDNSGLEDPSVTPGPTHTPVVPDVSASVVHGLENALELWPNTFYSFSVTGAGSENTNPGEGDVQWVPQYWVQVKSSGEESSKQTTWKIGAAKGIYEAKTLPIRIYLKKYVYQNGQWVGTEEYQYISYDVQTAALNASVTPGTGTDGTTTTTDQTALVADTTGTGETGATAAATNAATGDQSPLGTMMMLAAASLLAGGYVVVRRRKKDA